MNSFKRLLATGIIHFSSSLLGGCGNDVENPESTLDPAVARVQAAQEIKKTVSFLFEQKEVENQMKLSIYLDNPEEKPITSVQSWLTFNPELLQGLEVEVDESDFVLPAPYENGFDNKNGLLKVGRSAQGSVSDKKLLVAEVYFQPLRSGVAMVDVYDYKMDLSGRASANMVLDGVPYNLLMKPDVPAIVMEF